jgi:hypothetical protein
MTAAVGTNAPSISSRHSSARRAFSAYKVALSLRDLRRGFDRQALRRHAAMARHHTKAGTHDGRDVTVTSERGKGSNCLFATLSGSLNRR